MQQPMKILTILTYYYPHWTGLTAHAVKVAEGLAARGHQVTVLASRHEPDLPRDEVINGVRVVRLQPLARFSRGMITPALPWALYQLIKDHEVVQVHSPLPEGPLVAIIAKLLNTPVLMTHHGDLVMPKGPLNRLIEWVGFRVLKLTANLADAVTSYSRDYAENSRLLQAVRHKLSYIYPPVDLPEPDQEQAERWQQELGLEDKRLVGFSGRWVHEKGFDYLLEAIPRVIEEIPTAHFIFAGELDVVYEDFYERCRPMIEKNKDQLTFVGLIRDSQKMANFYAMCDLFVLPSRTDMMALVQVEAMLAGTPVVASDIPGARVVVRDTGYGQLTPPHDPARLAETIVDTMENLDRYRPNRQGVRRVFDNDRSYQSYERVMRRILDRNQGRHLAEKLGEDFSAVEIKRYNPIESLESLKPGDSQKLDNLLRNEADMAYRRRAQRLLDYLELNEGQWVLDGGCGMGVYLMLMGQLRELNLVGLDTWFERLQWAKQEKVPASLMQAGLYQTPFADQCFDSVLLSEVLEHIPHEPLALAEVHRVLKPGGVLAISVPHANYPLAWDPINKIWTGLGGSPFRSGPLVGLWSNHERLYWPEDLARLVREAGFEVEKIEEATHYSFPLIHFLVYGLGKPLLERNLLPEGLRKSADRFSGEQNQGSLLNPINIGVAMFKSIDAHNEMPQVKEKETFVNVLLKARKKS